MLTGEVLAANKSLDFESRKNYPVGSAAIGLRAIGKFLVLTMSMLFLPLAQTAFS